MLVALPFQTLCPNALFQCSSYCFCFVCVCVCISPLRECWSLLVVGLCLCSSSLLSCCLCVFLTDCAISVCLYLSLTWTTKQRYAHIFFHWVCLLVSNLSFIVFEGGTRCSWCSGGGPGTVHLGQSTLGCSCVCVCCTDGQQGTCAWAPGKGVAFLHRSRLAVHCLPLRECALLGVVKTWWPGVDQVRGACSALPEQRRSEADFWAVAVA